MKTKLPDHTPVSIPHDIHPSLLIPNRPSKRRGREQRGIALVMVLWLLVLMTVIASSHSRNVRTETRLALNHIELGKARNLAESAVHHTILEMLVADSSHRWKANGQVQHVRFKTGDAAISVRDTRGLVDLNAAHGTVLDAVFDAAGIKNPRQRQALVDAILDWRDNDSLKSLHGAEDEDYRQAGLKWAARDGFFTSIEELRYVMGMTNELFETLAPYLTVDSGGSEVMLEYAPTWLINVLAGNQEGFSSTDSGDSGRSPTVRITVQATTVGGTTASLAAVVHISPQGKVPYSILSWRMPARSPIQPTAERV